MKFIPHLHWGTVLVYFGLVSAFEKDPIYSQDELKYLVNTKHFIVFPLQRKDNAERFDQLSLEQYSLKIELYLSSLRNIN